ncbi:hypothetical protein DFH08DRAFT_821463 [Mycena albidolilacea]|uniref:Uncharacterized protein n=1 Tax=Mycena albidolilacea TaxID=1033008 RepID=A0AAD6ZB01_9AGAR|nr:hypothetical protein DFH08DRAFT_821463 [Mycena albidolilacea]
MSIGIYNNPGPGHITHASTSRQMFRLPDRTEVPDSWTKFQMESQMDGVPDRWTKFQTESQMDGVPDRQTKSWVEDVLGENLSSAGLWVQLMAKKSAAARAALEVVVAIMVSEQEGVMGFQLLSHEVELFTDVLNTEMADLHGPISYIEYLGEIAPHGLGTLKNRPNDTIWSHDHNITSDFEMDMVAILASAVEGNCDVNGEKKAMAGHLRRCTHLMAAENALAAEVNPTKAQQKATESKKIYITILGIKP